MPRSKILVVLLIAALMLQMFAMTSCVKDKGTEEPGNNAKPSILVSEASASAGDTKVKVTVALKNNPGVTSILLKIVFDDKALDLISVAYNSDIGGTCIPNATTFSPVTVYWTDGFKNVTGDWTFATLILNVADTAHSGEYKIDVIYNADDIYNAEETNVNFEVTAGKIIVS